jgi:hypothetical protein
VFDFIIGAAAIVIALGAYSAARTYKRSLANRNADPAKSSTAVAAPPLQGQSSNAEAISMSDLPEERRAEIRRMIRAVAELPMKPEMGQAFARIVAEKMEAVNSGDGDAGAKFDEMNTLRRRALDYAELIDDLEAKKTMVRVAEWGTNYIKKVSLPGVADPAKSVRNFEGLDARDRALRTKEFAAARQEYSMGRSFAPVALKVLEEAIDAETSSGEDLMKNALALSRYFSHGFPVEAYAKKEMLQKWWMTLEVDRRLAAGNKGRPPESFVKRFDPDAEMWLTYTELMALMFLAKPVIEGNDDGISDVHARKIVEDAFAAWAKDNPLPVC